MIHTVEQYKKGERLGPHRKQCEEDLSALPGGKGMEVLTRVKPQGWGPKPNPNRALDKTASIKAVEKDLREKKCHSG